jgi:signal transduction histidine kinase/CheY-like chemotaxis protein
MKIRTLLILMAVAILLPFALATTAALYQIREGQRETALRGLRETARATSLIVDRETQGSIAALTVLGNARSLAEGDMAAFYRSAAALNRHPDIWSFLLDDKGQQVFNTLVPFGTPPPPAVSAERVRKALQTGRPVISDLIDGAITKTKLTTINVPAAAGAGKYVVGQAFSVDHWTRRALTEKVPADWIVAVIDSKGKFIARSHDSQKYLGRQARPELVAAASQGDDGLIRHFTLEGIESYDAFTHSASTGWTIAVAAPVASIEAPSRWALWLALGGLLVTAGLTMLIVLLVARRFIGEFDSAGQAALSLGNGRKPTRQRSFITEVSQLHQALWGAGAVLESERESRIKAEAQREDLLVKETRAREAAQAENEAKDRFLAMLGHELRNPLAAISGALAVLEVGKLDPARREQFLAIVRRQSAHLGHIVDDLLDVSRLAIGKIELQRKPMDLAASVKHSVESMRQSGKGASHMILLEAESAWVMGDPVRIEQIVNNLIANALKFSAAGSEVRVTVTKEEGRACVHVQDHGAGIPPELLPRIFDPFVQGPPPANRAQSGLGIGLALVRQLVELHGGSVQAQSPGLGGGSAFRFCLPSIDADATPRMAAPLSNRPRRKLVYVEDNADARAAMAQLLIDLDYDLVQVHSGGATLEAVERAQPDVVVLDIGLPDIDGYQVARQLRTNERTAHVPLIALSGYGQVRDKDEAARSGFNAHLTKPVNPEDLVRTIESVINGV